MSHQNTTSHALTPTVTSTDLRSDLRSDPRPDPRTELPTDLPPNAGRAAAGVAIVLVAQLMLVLDATVVNVALPRIDEDLAFGPAGLSWVLNAYTLAFGGLLLLGGRLGDVFGRLRVFETGLALFTASSLLAGLADSPTWLVVTRALQGAGAALAAPGVLALLTTTAPDEAARRRGLALFAAVSSGGATIGLLLGGVLTDLGSWRWTMFINVPIGIAVLLTARRFLDETARRPGRFDVVGALAATGAATSLVWSLIGAPDHGWTSARTLGGTVLGLALLGLLVTTERRVAHPIVRPSLLRSRTRVAALAVMGLLMGAQMSMFFLAVQYLQRVQDLGPVASGAAFLPLSLGIFGVSRVTPRLVGRFGPIAMIVTGTLGLAASFVWISDAGAGDSITTAVLGPMLLNGVSAGLVFMPTTLLALADVEPEHAGAASGLLQTMQQLGAAVGLAVIVSVYAAGAVPGEFLPGAREAFLTSAVFALLATVAALAARTRTSGPAPQAGGGPADRDLDDPAVELAVADAA